MPFISEEDIAEYVEFLREKGKDTAKSAFYVVQRLFEMAWVDVQCAAKYIDQICEKILNKLL